MLNLNLRDFQVIPAKTRFLIQSNSMSPAVRDAFAAVDNQIRFAREEDPVRTAVTTNEQIRRPARLIHVIHPAQKLPEAADMVVIGIAGGVASGKSLVAQQLQQLGAKILDGDRTAHEVLREDDVKQAIRCRWGDDVFHADGEVNRSAVAKIVFAPPPDGPEQLTHLEQITHPRIKQRLQQRATELADSGVIVAVLDAAVMFKAGWDRICDKIVFVDAAPEIRLDRAQQRCWSEADFAAREAAQESTDEKRQRADYVIDNSGSPEETFAQVRQLWGSLHP